MPAGQAQPPELAPLLAKWRQSGQVANALLLTRGRAENAAEPGRKPQFETFAVLEFPSENSADIWSREAAHQCIGQVLQSARERHEPRPGSITRPALRPHQRDRPAYERSVVLLESPQAGQGVTHTKVGRRAGVDAADERVDRIIKKFAADAPFYKFRDRFFQIRATAGYKRFDQKASLRIE